MDSVFVEKATKDGDTVQQSVSRSCKTCQYRKDMICNIKGRPVPSDMKKPEWCGCRKVIGYYRYQRVDCVNCRYNKYVYKVMPTECKECKNIQERDKEYYIELPVFEENNK